MTEMYKSISLYFTHKDMPYNLRKKPTLCLPKTHSFSYSKNAIDFRGFLIWNNLSAVAETSDSLFKFKNKIKIFGDIDCGC